jgi:hypothetical protein
MDLARGHGHRDVAECLGVEMVHLHRVRDWDWKTFAPHCKFALPEAMSPLRMKVAKAEHLKMRNWLERQHGRSISERVAQFEYLGAASAWFPLIVV